MLAAKPSTPKLTRLQRLRLMAETYLDDRTIRRAYAGEPVRESVLERLKAACAKLGYPTP